MQKLANSFSKEIGGSIAPRITAAGCSCSKLVGSVSLAASSPEWELGVLREC